MSKPYFKDPNPQPSEEPHIQREIDNDKTGIIKRYLRLADEMLKDSDDDSTPNAA